MTENNWIILLLKGGLVTGLVSLVAWVAVYTWLTRGGALRNPVGVTLILKSLLIAVLFAVQILSLFFHLDGPAVHWLDVAFIWLVTPVMWWRTAVFMRIGRVLARRPARQDAQPAGPPAREQGGGPGE